LREVWDWGYLYRTATFLDRLVLRGRDGMHDRGEHYGGAGEHQTMLPEKIAAQAPFPAPWQRPPRSIDRFIPRRDCKRIGRIERERRVCLPTLAQAIDGGLPGSFQPGRLALELRDELGRGYAYG
jgi:hypothetical protein